MFPFNKTGPRSGIPHLGLQYKILEVTVIVKIACKQCQAHSTVTLINSQPASCRHCGAEYDCGGIQWDTTGQKDAEPKVAICAGPPKPGQSH